MGLFVHDSMHTTRNVTFELEHVWPALTPLAASHSLTTVEARTVPSAAWFEARPEVGAIVCAAEGRTGAAQALQ